MPRSFHSFLFDNLRPRPGRGPRPGRLPRSKPPLMASVPRGAIRSPSALAISGAERCAPAHLPEALGRRAIAVVGGVECGSQSGGLCLKEAILFRHRPPLWLPHSERMDRAAWPSVPCRAVSILSLRQPSPASWPWPTARTREPTLEAAADGQRAEGERSAPLRHWPSAALCAPAHLPESAQRRAIAVVGGVECGSQAVVYA